MIKPRMSKKTPFFSKVTFWSEFEIKISFGRNNLLLPYIKYVFKGVLFTSGKWENDQIYAPDKWDHLLFDPI